MTIKNAKQWIVCFLTLLGLCCSFAASADEIEVTYEIGPYHEGGYSASYVHSADYCNGDSTLGDYTLCMSGDWIEAITGSITGTLHDDGVLSGITGYLTNGDWVVDIIAGFLGPFTGGEISGLVFETLDVVIFEPFSMGDGMPNYFDGEEFILWGQSIGAYHCEPGAETCHYGNRFGLDLYGRRVAVPEPGTLALFGIGLIGIALTRRRRFARI